MVSERVSPPKWPQREWIASLCSFVLHLVVLIGLAVWSVRAGLVGDSLTIDSGEAESAELQVFEVADAVDIVEPQPLDAESSLPEMSLVPGMPSQTLVSEPSELPLPTISTDLMVELQTMPTGGGSLGFAESSMAGRRRENRARLALENGGSAESEQAVERALAYLAQHQLNDGSWSMLFAQACDGQCSPSCEGLDPRRFAATGLALLCFLGAGKTDMDEQYGQTVSKGVYFLLQNLRTNSSSGYWVGTEASAQMYEHGIATLAICEAYQMLGSGELKDVCQMAVNFIVEAQFRDGGWDYHPGTPGDLSIAAWQLMALKSAFAAELMVPKRTITGFDRFLDSARGGEFMYRYRDRKPTPSMTAIGMLMQIYRGKSGEARSVALAAEYLAKQEPSRNDLYYNYYATQAMFLFGGPLWKQWNANMRDYLIRTQDSDGHMAGSWWFDGDHSNKVGGRLYATCMACLTLEVYYRYLPVYSAPEQDFQF